MVKEVMKVTGGVLLGIVCVLVLTWLFMGNDFFMYKFFAPKTEAVRRQTLEQSKSYNQGMVQEIQNMQFDYINASPEHKAALASIILHRVADYGEEKLPADLRQFINGLKAGGL
ncbi:hypothetical protein [Oryzomonas rubra]|uniref:Uncharacterized protein n=1 Tax=Oryzomonas rubra TaxID=2509454 RepID=A0A5A9X956_9BACT|nr:hypothetical protein [Oryzomonas rubra]KAA0888729.1 hypothetical protein ET418_15220 [Oryzomonas rubra]